MASFMCSEFVLTSLIRDMFMKSERPRLRARVNFLIESMSDADPTKKSHAHTHIEKEMWKL